ncbi:NHL repeat-containing protein [Cylindrospermum sp. NIES-4074]|nr:NHL repeat-containing protein [Cylindrospermum sp. NIES-4074]
MKNRLVTHFDKINQRLNQIFQIRRLGKIKFIYFLLSLIVGIIVATLGITTDWTNTGTAASTYKTSWIGNSVGSGKLRVQNNIEAMYVASNGTVYTNSHWDEAGAEAGIYKDGKVIAVLDDTHGWSRGGGKAVIANNKYIYIAMIQGGIGNAKEDYPPKGTTWYCVRRYDLSGKPAPFSGGRGWDKSMLITSKTSEVTGLAIAGNKLYVSDSAANKIHVYNSDAMQEVDSFAVANPGAITVDKEGNLWIIHSKNGSNPAKVGHYSQTGKKLPQQITDVIEPTAIAIDNQGRLLIAENGPRQQVLIYNIKNQPVQVGTFGSKGGIYGGVPGEVQNLKLYGLTGVGTDGAGNFYINSNGFNKSGTDLRKFSPSGKQQWQLLGLIFVDNADADPQTDGVDLFTKQEHYLMNYSQPAGKQWIYKNYTLNHFKYPQDPRLHTSPDATFVRRIQGQRFLYITDMYGGFLQIYRFQPGSEGKIAIPAGMFVGSNGTDKKSISGSWPPYQPAKGEWIWRDRNGNGAFDQNEYDSSQDYPYMGGWWVDSQGDVWKTMRSPDGVGIRHYPLQGLDGKGNPIYTYSSMQKQKTPSLFTDLRRIEYFPKTDTMYLSGFTVDHPAFGDDTGVAGSEIVRFDNWSKGNRKVRSRIDIPYDTTGKREVSTAAMSVAGDYVFAATVKTAEVYVYNAATGEPVHKLKPGPEVGGETGWVDIPYGIRAFRRSNGEYLVFVEDNWKGKVLMYRLPK